MIRIIKHSDKALFLRMHVGNAETEEFQIDLGSDMGNGSFIGVVTNKKTGKCSNYSLPVRRFVEEILAVERGESECDDHSKEEEGT